MVQYEYAIEKNTGEVISIAEIGARKQRPPRGELLCPFCDSLMTPALGDMNQWHFRHDDTLDAVCPQEHLLHYNAKKKLKDRVQECLAKNELLCITVIKDFFCDCAIHHELGTPNAWQELSPVNLLEGYDRLLELRDAQRRWAPQLVLQGRKPEIILEVNAGKSVVERDRRPTIEFMCAGTKHWGLIESGRWDLLETRKVHWTHKPYKVQCKAGQNVQIWWGAKFSIGEPIVRCGTFEQFMAYKKKYAANAELDLRMTTATDLKTKEQALGKLFPMTVAQADAYFRKVKFFEE